MAVRSVDVAQWGQVGCRTQGRSIVLLTNWDVGGQSCCILGYIIDNVEHALLVGRSFISYLVICSILNLLYLFHSELPSRPH
jgi:hypothetical protein